MAFFNMLFHGQPVTIFHRPVVLFSTHSHHSSNTIHSEVSKILKEQEKRMTKKLNPFRRK